MWESIGAYRGPPRSQFTTSWDAGSSSGAAPALTQFVPGVTPAGPGHDRFDARPYPAPSIARAATSRPRAWKGNAAYGKPVQVSGVTHVVTS